MELTDGDVAEYEARGLLCFSGLLQGEEVAALQGALPAALLAILVELSFELLERRIVRPHMISGELTS